MTEDKSTPAHDEAVVERVAKAIFNTSVKAAGRSVLWDEDNSWPTLELRSEARECARAAIAAMRGVETGSAIEAPRAMSGLSHDAMKECVEALKDMRDAAVYQCAAHADLAPDSIRDEADRKLGVALDRARSALAKLDSRYVRGDEAAAFLGIDRRRLDRLDDLPRCVLGPRTIRFDMEDLRDYRRRLPLPDTESGMAKLIIDRNAETPTDGGFLYFMQCKGIVKMGWSARPEARLRELRRMIPFDLTLLGYIPGSVTAEKQLHVLFRPLRAGHLEEWYREEPFLRVAHLVMEATNG